MTHNPANAGSHDTRSTQSAENSEAEGGSPQNTRVSGERDSAGRFLPGTTGNAGGRPKNTGYVRELAREHTEKAIDALASALQSMDERIRIAAAVALLDRAWGKPREQPEVAGAGTEQSSKHLDLSKLSTPELGEFRRLALKARYGDGNQGSENFDSKRSNIEREKHNGQQ